MNRKSNQRLRLNIDVKPFSRKQKKVLSWWMPSSPVRDMSGIIADGAIRSGKTFSMAMSFIMWAMYTFDGKDFAMCGRTISSFRRNVLTWLLLVLRFRRYQVQHHRTDNLVVIRYGGHENSFYIFGGQNEGSQDLIQGMTLAGVFFDEVALMPESFVNQATARCSVDGSKKWFNCNPRGPMHWFKINWIDEKEKKCLFYLHFMMDDNLSLSPEKRKEYERDYVGAFYNRYVLGKWELADGGIYDMWDEEQNTFSLKETPISFAKCQRYIAIDYGTSNPMVFLDARDDGDTLWIVNEYYYDGRKKRQQKTDAQYADDFEKFIDYDDSVFVILDPSASSFRVELRNRGYRVKDADNGVLDGLRVTSTVIQQRRLRVERDNTPMLQKERATYVWDEKAVMRGEEAPVKLFDHAMDAMRYLVKTVITPRRLRR